MSVLDSFSLYDSGQLIACVICGMTQWMPSAESPSLPCTIPLTCRMCMSGRGGDQHEMLYDAGKPVASGVERMELCIV